MICGKYAVFYTRTGSVVPQKQVSAQLLAPITPHTSEHIWINLLKKSGSILNSGWPAGR
jgi:leucyl-tRNA synthetase